jgi:hypothetical protein
VAQGWHIVALLCASCGFRVPGTAAPGDDDPMSDAPAADDWLPGFASRKAIDLAGGSVEVPGFVASITEGSDADLIGAPALAFTAADGTTPLPSELVEFDPASGKLEAFVQISLLASAPSRVYLYYGDGPAPAVPSPWGAAFAGVWHMTASGTSGDTTLDSKGTNHATAAVTQIPGVAGGMSGVARDYDGIDDKMSIADPTDGSLDVGSRSFSVGLWVNVTSSAGSFDMPFFKGGSSAGTPGFDFELGENSWLAGFSDGTQNPILAQFGTETALLGAWHHLVVTCDRTTNTIQTYVDAAPVTTVGFTRASFDSPYDVDFGNATYEFKGLLDEVRIYTDALPAAWVAAEHANLAQRSVFVQVRPAEQRP